MADPNPRKRPIGDDAETSIAQLRRLDDIKRFYPTTGSADINRLIASFLGVQVSRTLEADDRKVQRTGRDLANFRQTAPFLRQDLSMAYVKRVRALEFVRSFEQVREVCMQSSDPPAGLILPKFDTDATRGACEAGWDLFLEKAYGWDEAARARRLELFRKLGDYVFDERMDKKGGQTWWSPAMGFPAGRTSSALQAVANLAHRGLRCLENEHDQLVYALCLVYKEAAVVAFAWLLHQRNFGGLPLVSNISNWRPYSSLDQMRALVTIPNLENATIEAHTLFEYDSSLIKRLRDRLCDIILP